MIVLKHNGTVYIAKSCWGMRDPEAIRLGIPDEENLCMWHPKRRRNRVIAMSGVGRFTDIIRYENIFPSVLDQKHIVLETYDKMYALGDRFGLCDDHSLPCRTVFAEDDKAYVMHYDGATVEIENIFALGCEDESVMALYDLKGADDPYKFFKEAFATVESVRRYVMFPVVVLNTKNNKIEVINR